MKYQTKICCLNVLLNILLKNCKKINYESFINHPWNDLLASETLTSAFDGLFKILSPLLSKMLRMVAGTTAQPINIKIYIKLTVYPLVSPAITPQTYDIAATAAYYIESTIPKAAPNISGLQDKGTQGHNADEYKQ